MSSNWALWVDFFFIIRILSPLGGVLKCWVNQVKAGCGDPQPAEHLMNPRLVPNPVPIKCVIGVSCVSSDQETADSSKLPSSNRTRLKKS